jgi:signal transduction histidine kinase
MSVALPAVVRPERGFGPQWWTSGVRTRRWWAFGALTVAILFADVGADVVWGPLARAIGAAWIVWGMAEIAVGLLFWMWRPGNIVGPLLLTYVVLICFSDVPDQFPDSRFGATFGDLFQFSWACVYLWMLFSFPNGRMWNRAALWLVVGVTVYALSWGVPSAFFGTPRTYLYVGHGWSGLVDWAKVWALLLLVCWGLVTAFLVVRVVRAAPGARRRLIPLFGLFLCSQWFGSSQYIYTTFTGRYYTGSTLYSWVGQAEFVTLLSAIGAAFGLVRVRQKRSSVADLVVQLGKVEPGNVRGTLARTLGDPSLELGLWLPEHGFWVDEDGRELAIPADNGARGVTYVGDRLAVMVHDRDLLDQPRLLEAVGSAGRLALENERLQAELRAQLAELRESRSRIVQAGDAERRRLERDLHDGAQQRLLAVGMALQLLGSNLNANRAAHELLGETEAELQGALRELRELARGIHPAVLTDQGLDAAVRTLAERAPVPVSVETTSERLPGYVETAAYFVVAEALANVAKYAHASHAWVTIAHANADAVIEVGDDGIGGADMNSGSGLRGLADRVGALDGQLSVESAPGEGTRIRAVIPCEPVASVSPHASEVASV